MKIKINLLAAGISLAAWVNGFAQPAVIEFFVARDLVREPDISACIYVVRSGDRLAEVSVEYATSKGTAFFVFATRHYQRH